jgi:hypothetical protein
MKFLLDHDVPDDIEYSLTALGHAVVKLRESLPATTTDEDVLRFAAPKPHTYGLVRLIDNAGESGLRGNVNFA